jgi:hypothetical protein
VRAVWFAILGAACAPPPAPARPVVSPVDWVRVLPADDPWGDPGAADVCDPFGYGPSVELGEPTFDVRTGLCDPITARATTLAAAVPGEVLSARIWHYALITPGREPGVAELILEVAEHRWTTRIDIPAEAGMVEATWPITEAFSPGADAWFHLQNHGANSWHLFEVVAGPLEPPDR